MLYCEKKPTLKKTTLALIDHRRQSSLQSPFDFECVFESLHSHWYVYITHRFEDYIHNVL